MISPVVSMTRVRSDEFCTSDRNRSSLARNRASARSFWSVTAPAIRTTITTAAASSAARPWTSGSEISDGAMPRQIAS